MRCLREFHSYAALQAPEHSDEPAFSQLSCIRRFKTRHCIIVLHAAPTSPSPSFFAPTPMPLFFHVNTAGTVLRIVDSTMTATGRYLDHRLAFRCPFLQQVTVSPARLALALGICIMGTRSSVMLSRKGRIVQNRCYEDKWRECDNKNLRFHDRKRNTARLQRRLLCKFQ